MKPVVEKAEIPLRAIPPEMPRRQTYRTSIGLALLLTIAGIGVPLTPTGLKRQPNDLACPVTPNLFPKQVKLNDSIRYLFSKKEDIVRRISVSLSGGHGLDQYDLDFCWAGDGADDYEGTLQVIADGRANCFFLDRYAYPSGHVCKEFSLQVPSFLQIKDIAFSSVTFNGPMKTCPMPELATEINRAIEAFEFHPEDEAVVQRFLSLLEKATFKYDCRRSIDYEPVPAWFLVGYETAEQWMGPLFRIVDARKTMALKVFMEFFATLTGGLMDEGFCLKTREMLLKTPDFFLESWETIRPYKEEFFSLSEFLNSKELEETISRFRDIAKDNPQLRPACEEIIAGLEKK